MNTFREIGERVNSYVDLGCDEEIEDSSKALWLIQDLAKALDVFEHNTARMFAVFNVSAISDNPEQLQRQIRERTVFALEELRRETL